MRCLSVLSSLQRVIGGDVATKIRKKNGFSCFGGHFFITIRRMRGCPLKTGRSCFHSPCGNSSAPCRCSRRGSPLSATSYRLKSGQRPFASRLCWALCTQRSFEAFFLYYIIRCQRAAVCCQFSAPPRLPAGRRDSSCAQ